MATYSNRRDAGFQALEQRQLLSGSIETWVFANNSIEDGFDPALNAADEAAIYRGVKPAESADRIFSYNQVPTTNGITGVMIDVLGTGGELKPKDFEFAAIDRAVNGKGQQQLKPSDFLLRQGVGLDGADRVLFAFEPGQIRDGELIQITVNANKSTGLSEPETFLYRAGAVKVEDPRVAQRIKRWNRPDDRDLDWGVIDFETETTQKSASQLESGSGVTGLNTTTLNASASSSSQSLTAAEQQQKSEIVQAFEDVYNNIKVEFYRGNMRSSDAVERTGYGNDYDQAALLKSKIDTILGTTNQTEIRFVDIDVANTDLATWMGVTNTGAFGTLYKYENVNSTTTRFRHFVLQINALDWPTDQLVDPSWKFRNLSSRLSSLNSIGTGSLFDIAQYAGQYGEDPLEWYESKIRTHINNTPDAKGRAGLSDLAYDGPIIQKDFDDLPTSLPDTYTVTGSSTSRPLSEINGTIEHKVRIEIDAVSVPDSHTPPFTHTLTTVEASDNDVTIRYTPATNGKNANLYVGASLKGTVYVPNGDDLNIVVKLLNNLELAQTYTYDFKRDVNEPIHILIDVGQHTAQSVSERMDAMISIAKNDTSATTTSSLSSALLDKYQRHLMGLLASQYGHRFISDSRVIAGYVGAIWHPDGANIGLVTGVEGAEAFRYESLQNSYVFYDTTDLEGMSLDLPGLNTEGLPTDGVASRSTTLTSVLGMSGSFYESAVIEEVLGTESVSTAKGIQWALQNGAVLHTFSPNNEVSDLGTDIGNLFGSDNSQFALDTEQDLKQLINSGTKIIVPSSLVQMNDWRGAVWISDISNLFGYSILRDTGDGSFGGRGTANTTSTTEQFTSQTVSQIPIRLGVQNSTNFALEAGDPVNTNSGSLYHDEVDFTIPLPNTPLTFARHYDSNHEDDRGLGVGWSYTFSDWLSVESNGDVIWTTGGGEKHRFLKDGSNYENPAGLYGVFQKLSNNTYTYTSQDGTIHTFGTTGRLTTIRDRYGVGFNIHYMAGTGHEIDYVRFASVIQADSRNVLDFAYIGSQVTVKDMQGNRTWTYDVDTVIDNKNHLSKMTSPQASISSGNAVKSIYTYYGAGTVLKGLLKTIERKDGPDIRAETIYHYYPNRRVYKTQEVYDREGSGANEVLNLDSEYFVYDQFFSEVFGEQGIPAYTRSTTHIDYNGNATEYIFNKAGMHERTIFDDRDRIDQKWAKHAARADNNDPGTAKFVLQTRTNEVGLEETYLYDGVSSAANQGIGSVTHGNVTSILQANGVQRHFTYDSNNHNVLTHETIDGTGSAPDITTVYTYGSNGELESVTDPTNRKTTYLNHDAYGRPTKMVLPKGNVSGAVVDDYATIYAYDSVTGQIDTESRRLVASGPFVVMADYDYDSYGNVEYVTDATGRQTKTEYDELGRLIKSIIDPGISTGDLNLITTYSYLDDLVTKVEYPDGRKTVNTYDEAGRMTASTGYGLTSGGASLAMGTTTYTYDPMGNVLSDTSPLGYETRFLYDSRDRLVQTLLPNGSFVLVGLDGSSREVIRRTPRADLANDYGLTETKASIIQYDSLGRLRYFISPADQNGNYETIKSLYDSYGRSYGSEVYIDVDDVNTANWYNRSITVRDDAGRVWLQRSSDGTSIQNEYDQNGNLDYTITFELNGDSNRLPAFAANLDGYDHNQIPADWVYHTWYTYDHLDRLRFVTDPEGNVFQTDYDAAGRVEYQYDPRSIFYFTKFVYDGAGRLSETILPDPDGLIGGLVMNEKIEITYDATGRIKTQTDARGHTTTYDYWEEHNATSGKTWSRVKRTDREGNVWLEWYDLEGRLERTANPEGGYHHFYYDEVSNKIEERGPRPTSESTIEPRPTTKWEYNAAGNVKTMTNADELTTAYEYDDLGRVIEERYQNADDGDDRLRSYVYKNNNLVKTTDERGFIAEFLYDKAGRVTHTFAGAAAGVAPNHANTANDYLKSLKTYFTTGQVKQHLEYSEVGIQSHKSSRYHYDKNGRLERVSEARPDTGNHENTNTSIARWTDYTYDAAGNTETVTNAEGEVTEYKYDGRGRLYEQINPDPDGAGPKTGAVSQWTYDANDNLKTFTDPELNVTTYFYDDMDRLEQEQMLVFLSAAQPSVLAVKTYEYDKVGSRTQEVQASGKTRNFEYDDLNRMIGERWYASKTDADQGANLQRYMRFEYDISGRMTAADSDGTSQGSNDVVYEYDNLGSLTRVYDQFLNGTEFLYDHNASGLVDEAIYKVQGVQDSKVTSEYNYAGLVTNRHDTANNKRVGFTYNLQDQLKEITQYSASSSLSVTGNHVPAAKRTYYYNAADQLDTIRKGNSQAIEHDYAYDKVERITGWQINGGTNRVYGYWDDGQLKTADGNTFTYDDNGNRLSDGAVTSTTGVGNRLKEDSNFVYKYDLDGNMTEKSRKSDGELTRFVYDHRNRLTQVTLDATGSNQAVVKHGYNAVNERFVKRIDGVETERYVYDGGILKYVLSSSATGKKVMARYLHGAGQALVEDRATTPGGSLPTRWLFTDHLGTVREAQNMIGQVVKSLDYDAYGTPTVATGTAETPYLRYTGQMLDEDTGLYDYKARWYDSSLGRFLNIDPIQDGTNHFIYVSNSPLNYTDPTGLKQQTWTDPGNPDKVGGGILNGVSNYIKNSYAGIFGGLSNVNQQLENLAVGVGRTINNTVRPIKSATEALVIDPLAASFDRITGNISYDQFNATVNRQHQVFGDAVYNAVSWDTAKSVAYFPKTLANPFVDPISGAIDAGLRGDVDGVSNNLKSFGVNGLLTAAGAKSTGFSFSGTPRLDRLRSQPMFTAQNVSPSGSVSNAVSPSGLAQSFQGSGRFPGMDRFRDITLKQGKVVLAGEPGLSGFATTTRAFDVAGTDATKLFQGLQVPTRQGKFRPTLTGFEILQDTPAAFGRVKANTQFGQGGLPQLFIPDFEQVAKPIFSVPLTNRAPNP